MKCALSFSTLSTFYQQVFNRKQDRKNTYLRSFPVFSTFLTLLLLLLFIFIAMQGNSSYAPALALWREILSLYYTKDALDIIFAGF